MKKLRIYLLFTAILCVLASCGAKPDTQNYDTLRQEVSALHNNVIALVDRIEELEKELNNALAAAPTFGQPAQEAISADMGELEATPQPADTFASAMSPTPSATPTQEPKATPKPKATLQPTATPTPKPTPSPTPEQRASNTVYITKTGEKYHRSGCQYLAKSKIAIDLEDARQSGYTPCSKCY